RNPHRPLKERSDQRQHGGARPGDEGRRRGGPDLRHGLCPCGKQQADVTTRTKPGIRRRHPCTCWTIVHAFRRSDAPTKEALTKTHLHSPHAGGNRGKLASRSSHVGSGSWLCENVLAGRVDAPPLEQCEFAV